MSNDMFKTAKELDELTAEELLGLELDSLADVEELKNLPNGLYRFSVKECGTDNVGQEEKLAIVTDFEITEVVELDNPDEAEEVGELPRAYKENYGLETKSGFGTRVFATFFRELATRYECKTVAELVEQVAGSTGTCYMKTRKMKSRDGESFERNQWDPKTVTFD